MKVLILAGGTGTRLWPVSTKKIPKQFLKLQDDKSMLQLTYERVLPLVESKDDIFISTNEQYVEQILDDLNSFSVSKDSIITEPAKKNTGPALALAMSYLKEVVGCGDDEIVLSVHADQMIAPKQTFVAYVKGAIQKTSEGCIVTFGITPTRPEIGYGYIQVDMDEVAEFAQSIQQFVEKPDLITAKKYVQSGNYYRNSGTFMFPLGKTIEELSRFSPELNRMLGMGYVGFYDKYSQVESVAIDVVLMEKTSLGYVVPMHIQRSDVGSWDSMYDISSKDEDENVIVGDIKINNVRSSYVRSEDVAVRVNDVENIVVVASADGVYITSKGNTQGVKELL